MKIIGYNFFKTHRNKYVCLIVTVISNTKLNFYLYKDGHIFKSLIITNNHKDLNQIDMDINIDKLNNKIYVKTLYNKLKKISSH